MFGDVRRRKKTLVNLTKRLRNSERALRGRREGDAKDALFSRGTHIGGFYENKCILGHFYTQSHLLSSCKVST